MPEGNDTPNTEPKQPPATGDAPGQQSGAPLTFTAEQQAHIDKLLGERLQRARDKWEADNKAASDKAAEEAEKQRLTEQQKYKELAEKADTRVKELEPLVDKVKRQDEALGKILEQQRKGLPEHIIALLDKVGDPLEQLAWLAENASKAKPKIPDIDGGRGSTDTPPADDREAIWRRYGIHIKK